MARIIEGDQGEAGRTDPRREIRCLSVHNRLLYDVPYRRTGYTYSCMMYVDRILVFVSNARRDRRG